MAFERLSVPRHSVDAVPRFVPIRDTAWDIDRVANEFEVAGATREAESWHLVRQHPFLIYHLGESRYDLDAAYQLGDGMVSARSYLRSDQSPLVVELSRLGHNDWYEVESRRQENPGRAMMMACRIGVAKIDNCPIRLPGYDQTGRMSDADVGRLFDLYPGEREKVLRVGPVVVMVDPESLPYQIGEAVWRASRPPSESEKKA